MVRRIIVLLFFALIVTGCRDKALVNVYDPKVLQADIDCMSLTVYPEDKNIDRLMHKLYPFKEACPMRLEVSYKGAIVCNSNQNADKKALTSFPQSYLRMEIKKGFSLKYSYYIDLTHSDITNDDIKNAYERISSDIRLKR